MEQTSKDNEKEKIRTAHSNFRKGLNDYNDGFSLTHYLGNNDYDGSNVPEVKEGENQWVGKEASGNDFLEENEDN